MTEASEKIAEEVASVLAEEDVTPAASTELKPGDPGYVEPKPGDPGYVLKPGDPGFVEPAVLKPGDPGYVEPVAPQGLTIQQMANVLKKRVTNSDFTYEIPKEILEGKKEDGTVMTEDELFDAFRGEIYKFTDFGDDDFIMEYREARKGDQNFNPDNWIQERAKRTGFENLSNDEKIFLGLKARLGNDVKDEDIREHIKTLTPIEKVAQAKAITAAYSEQMTAAQKIKAEENKKANLALITKRQNDDTQALDVLFKKLSTVDNIGGLPHGKAAQESFQPAFRDLYQIDPETGNRRYEKLFEDPETLYNALLFTTMLKGGQIKAFLTKFKEAYKDSTIDKLGIGQRLNNDGTVITHTPPNPADFMDE